MAWHLPAEFRWFKAATMGQAILMGRKTFESIGRPLPGRLNLVVSRQLGAKLPEGVEGVADLDRFDPDSVSRARVFVAGGAEVYAALLPRCAELWLTELEADYEGDALMPPFEGEFEPREILNPGSGFSVRRWVARTSVLPLLVVPVVAGATPRD